MAIFCVIMFLQVVVIFYVIEVEMSLIKADDYKTIFFEFLVLCWRGIIVLSL
jgi:hypothetical protein